MRGHLVTLSHVRAKKAFSQMLSCVRSEYICFRKTVVKDIALPNYLFLFVVRTEVKTFKNTFLFIFF